jgi:hypothetical protein
MAGALIAEGAGMSRIKSLSVCVAISLLGAVGCGGGADDEPFEAPAQSVHGASYGEWAARWWQWALSIPAADNPVLDGPCATSQDGDVFFLAGNFGGDSTRTCTVPSGKALFFPVVNFICYPSPENPDEGCSTPATEAELTTCAQGGIDGVPTTMSVIVDGQELDDPAAYVATSSQFSWTAPADEADYLFPGIGPITANTCGIAEGDRYGVTDGYWIMMKPLSPGQHTVEFSGSIGATDPFTLHVSYDITQE